MSIVGYQSTLQKTPTNEEKALNSQKEIALRPNYISPLMFNPLGRNIIAVINENIVIIKDVRIRARNGKKTVLGWLISLPAPINNNQQVLHTGIMLTRKGRPFYYSIGTDGRVFINGEFEDEEDEIVLNITPYVAKLPLKFKSFPIKQPPIITKKLSFKKDTSLEDETTKPTKRETKKKENLISNKD